MRDQKVDNAQFDFYKTRHDATAAIAKTAEPQHSIT